MQQPLSDLPCPMKSAECVSGEALKKAVKENQLSSLFRLGQIRMD